MSGNGAENSESTKQDGLVKVLKEIAVDLKKQGFKLSSVGQGSDTLYLSLASQMKNFNLGLRKNVSQEDGSISENPASAREIRLEVLRCIASNIEKLRDERGIKDYSEISASAQRFGVRILLYEIGSNFSFSQSVFDPWNTQPKSVFRMLRYGKLYISTIRDVDSQCSSICENISDVDLIRSLERYSENNFAALDTGEENRMADEKSDSESDHTDVVQTLKEAVESGSDSTLECSTYIEQDIFLALAKQLQVAGLPLVSTTFGGQGAPIALLQSSRILRSEIITLASVNSRFSNMKSPQRELAAAAYKYRLEVRCISFENGQVVNSAFKPPDDVPARGSLFLAYCGDYFWSTVPKAQAESFRDSWSNFTRPLKTVPVGQNLDSSEDKELSRRDEGAGSLQNPKSKTVVFDPVTLSWKLSGSPLTPSSDEYSSKQYQTSPSQFLPRKLGGSQAVGSVAQLGGSEGKGPKNVEALKEILMDQGLRIDDSEEGSNVFLALARLFYSANLTMQGLMFTAFESNNEGSLIGAMSRKARTDTKAYIQEHMNMFDHPGQWPGDHDLLAAAKLYQVRINLYMVVYNRDIRTHCYEPETSNVRNTMNICLHKGLFWPIIAINQTEIRVGWPSDQQFAQPSSIPVVPPAERKRASALDKILYRFGAMQTDTVPLAKIEPSRLDRERDWWAGKDFGETEVTGAVSAASGCLILLHGLASSGADLQGLAVALHMPWLRVVIPVARRRLASVACEVVPSWFDLSPGAFRTQSSALNSNFRTSYRIQSTLAVDSSELEASIEHVKLVIEKEISIGVPMDRIVLAGFSQGGGLALACALQLQMDLAAVIAINPIIPPHLIKMCNDGLEGLVPPSRLPQPESTPAILVLHGDKDRISSLPFYQPFYEWLAKLGISVQVTVQEGAKHTLGIEQLLLIRDFLLESLPPPPFSPRVRSAGSDEADYESGRGALKEFADKWRDPAERIWMSVLQRGKL